MKVKMLLVLLLGFSVIGCTTTASYDYDDSVNFSQLKTYAWVVESKAAGDDGSFYLSEISHRRMIDAIDNNLVRKGLTKVAPGQADVMINYHAAVNKKIERDIEPTHSYYWRFGHYYHANRLGWSYDFNHRVREYKEGSLVIDFINNQQELVWRGSKGSRLTSKQTPEERTQDINETVATILENFPPRQQQNY